MQEKDKGCVTFEGNLTSDCIRLGSIEYVVSRDEEGTLHAFHNVCRHHASLLASGTGKSSCFVCPYHVSSCLLDSLKVTYYLCQCVNCNRDSMLLFSIFCLLPILICFVLFVYIYLLGLDLRVGWYTFEGNENNRNQELQSQCMFPKQSLLFIFIFMYMERWILGSDWCYGSRKWDSSLSGWPSGGRSFLSTSKMEWLQRMFPIPKQWAMSG